MRSGGNHNVRVTEHTKLWVRPPEPNESNRNEAKLIIEINRSPGEGEHSLLPGLGKPSHMCVPCIQPIRRDHRHQRSTTTTIVAKLDHQAAQQPANQGKTAENPTAPATAATSLSQVSRVHTRKNIV